MSLPHEILFTCQRYILVISWSFPSLPNFLPDCHGRWLLASDLEEVRTWRKSGLGWSQDLEEGEDPVLNLLTPSPSLVMGEQLLTISWDVLVSLLFPTLVDLFSAVVEVLGQKRCFVYIFQDKLRELITILYVLPVFTLHPNPWDINYVSKMAIPKGLNYLNYLFCTQGLLQNNLFAL